MEATHCQIVLVQPEGNVHAQAFQELSETLLHGLRRLGMPARVATNEADEAAVNLILGWHLLGDDAMARLPQQSILYNLEQLDEKNAPLLARLIRLGTRFEVWDYSRRNLEILEQAGFTGTLNHVPVGFAAELDRIPKAARQDIDVLFYGSVNERRLKVLQGLQAAGLRTEAVFGAYGAERDALISRAKVVLNMHFYDSSIFEVVRVSYLLANRKAVVAECHEGTDIDPELREAVRAVPYEGLVEACRELVADDEARAGLEARGHAIFSARREEDILAGVLGLEPEVVVPPTPPRTASTKGPVKKRYVIYGPVWHHRSGGLMALYNLQKELIRKGFDCVYYCFGAEQVAINEICDYDIVIYPEIVVGNPLRAKHVVRWLLNDPGVCGGDGIYDPGDLVFCYIQKSHFPNMKGHLFIPFFDENLKDLGYEKTHDCFWVYKGMHKKRIPIHGIEITPDWPRSKAELIDLLQHCRTFYSYDEATAMVEEARRCGCEVKLIQEDGSIIPFPFNAEDYWYFEQSSAHLEAFIGITQAVDP